MYYEKHNTHGIAIDYETQHTHNIAMDYEKQNTHRIVIYREHTTRTTLWYVMKCRCTQNNIDVHNWKNNWETEIKIRSVHRKAIVIVSRGTNDEEGEKKKNA